MPIKLKKIPIDLMSYIQNEAESIKDNNDKIMISSYCLGKLELITWYMELLGTKSKKFIVPHNKAQFECMRNQLLECHKMIMGVKLVNPSERPLIEIKYPKGYEG